MGKHIYHKMVLLSIKKRTAITNVFMTRDVKISNKMKPTLLNNLS